MLLHTSGEYLSERLLIPVDKANAHGVGSCITYSRRFSLMAFAGVVGDEDDDGNAAVGDKPAKQEKVIEPDPVGKKALEACGSINALQEAWKDLTPAQRATLGPTKDKMKEQILAADRAAAEVA
jgi:hypothetical protein